MRNSLLAVICCIAIAPSAQAGWGTCLGPTGPLTPYMFAQPPGVYQWKAIDDGWHQLWQGGFHVGAFHPEVGYRAWSGGKWHEPGQAPITPPVPFTGKKAKVVVDDPDPITQNFGVDSEKLGGVEKFKINGQVVSKSEIIQAIEKGTLTDDSKKFRLVVIGPESDRKKALAEIAGNDDAKKLLADCIVQDYAPDHWHVSKVGFKTDGKPTVYYQKFDGKVLHRQDDFEGGAPKLFEAIRKSHPDYDPKKDPDLRKPPAPAPNPNNPTPGPNPQPNSPIVLDGKSLPWLLVAGLGVAVLYLLPTTNANKKE